MKASLSQDINMGLPFTFNRDCQYDTDFCDLEFYGSETAGDLSYDNAYQAWRNAQADAQNGSYSSYMMGNTLLKSSSGYADTAQIPYGLGAADTDVKVTDVTDRLPTETGERFVVGYSSAPYQDSVRDFVRRAFIKTENGTAISLMPQAFTGDNGGFSSAYQIKQIGSTPS